jgi:hypothetical protein
MGGVALSHTFALKGICLLNYRRCILVVENLGDYAERVRRTIVASNRERFFCISKGSSFLKEAETLDCFDIKVRNLVRTERDSKGPSAREILKAIENLPGWRSHDLGQVISLKSITGERDGLSSALQADWGICYDYSSDFDSVFDPNRISTHESSIRIG